MKIFTATSVAGFELVHPKNPNDFELFTTQINGEKRGHAWFPVGVTLIRQDEREGKLSEAGAPWLGSHALVLRRKTVESLGPFLRGYGELLPLRCDDAELFVYNPTVVIDAIDENAADIARFKDGGIMRIRKYAFRPEIVAKADIFKIPTLSSSPVFFSDRAVKVWKNSGITGVAFKEVWNQR